MKIPFFSFSSHHSPGGRQGGEATLQVRNLEFLLVSQHLIFIITARKLNVLHFLVSDLGFEKLDFIIEFLSKNMFLALILKTLLKLEKYFTIKKTLNKELECSES